METCIHEVSSLPIERHAHSCNACCAVTVRHVRRLSPSWRLLFHHMKNGSLTAPSPSCGSFCIIPTRSTAYHADWLAVLPLFGSYPAKYNQLKETASVGFSVSTFKRLHDNGGEPSEDGWWVGSEPAGVFTLSNGSTLFDVPLTPSSGPATAIPAPGALLDLGALSILTSSVAETASRLIARPEVSLGAFVGDFSRSFR